jgi:ABC-2 type transport system ATP-binding protein
LSKGRFTEEAVVSVMSARATDHTLRPLLDRATVQNATSSREQGIRVRGLSKIYRNPWTLKRTVALADLDLEVRRGEVFGYLGPNGAGKTTTLKILTGLLRATRGEAWILGVPVGDVSSRRSLGFLPEQPYFYDYLTGPEYLEMVGQLSGLLRHEAGGRARQWFERVGLGGRARLMLRKYSKGMLQRLGLAAALLHEPDVVILDEPMSGLDPFGRRDVRELIQEQRARGATVLFSSHILPDAEMLCDRAAIVLDGRLQRVVTLAELQRGGVRRVEIRLEGVPLLELPPPWSGRVERLPHAVETVLRVDGADLAQEVLRWVVERNARVLAVEPQRGTLEDLFIATARQASAPGEERPASRRRSA